MSYDQPSNARKDRVWNAETCRALRQYAHSRSGAAVGVLAVALVVLYGIEAAFPDSPFLKWVTLGYAIALIATAGWIIFRSGPPMEPVPALAAGREPWGWTITIAVPVELFQWGVTSTAIPVPLVAVGCLAVGGLLFQVIGDMIETYPPEQSMEN